MYDNRMTFGVRNALALLALLLPAAAVQAGDWYTLALSDQALMVVDRNAARASIHRGTVEEVQIFAHPRAVAGAGQPVRRLDIALQIDCRTRRLRPSGFTVWSEAGEQLLAWQADANQAQWLAPEADSANTFLLEAVCDRKWAASRLRTGVDLQQLQRQYVAAATGQ